MLIDKTKKPKNNANPSSAFTIIELLVVIVVIGILASITIVSYIGVVQKTKVASLKADLSTSAQRIKLFQVDNDFYPHQINDCPSPATTNLCLTPSNNATYDYTVNNSTNPKSFTLIATADDGITKYQITEGGGITEVAAAVPKGSFIKEMAGTNVNEFNDVKKTSDGGYVIAGYTDNFGSGGDGLIAKYTNNNDLSWSKTWGGAGSDSIDSVIQSSDGGYVIAGSTDSFGAGSSDAFVAKFSGDGNLQWSQTWGGENDDITYGLMQDPSGDYVIVGETNSYTLGGGDAFVAKFSGDGNLQWSRTWGGVYSDYANSIVQISDGSYVVLVYSSSFSYVYSDVFVVGLSSDGAYLWSSVWGDPNKDDIPSDIASSSDGGFVVTGYTERFNDYPKDAFIAKYTSNGSVSWLRTIGNYDFGDESSMGVSVDSDGGYIITGSSSGFNSNGNDDAYIAKVGASGDLLWNVAIGGNIEGNYPNAISQISDGGYVMVGHSRVFRSNNRGLIARFNSDHSIDGCPESVCYATALKITASPVIEVTSPAFEISSPTVASTSPPANSLVFGLVLEKYARYENVSFEQELLVMYLDVNQNTCKDWTAPDGKKIKEFRVVHVTEDGHDFFNVSIDGVQKYNGSGENMGSTVAVDNPGSVISVCLTTDSSTGESMGGMIEYVGLE